MKLSLSLPIIVRVGNVQLHVRSVRGKGRVIISKYLHPIQVAKASGAIIPLLISRCILLRHSFGKFKKENTSYFHGLVFSIFLYKICVFSNCNRSS